MESMMKKVTLVVPDSIDVMLGSSRGAKATKKELIPENLMKVLCDRTDYHQHYYFKDSSKVKIVSIVDLDI
jgi:hypothetical protein